MKKVGVAILGLGVVGGGTYQILTEHREFYQRTQGVDIVVESVLELNRERAHALGVPDEKIASNIAEIVSNPDVNIVVEVIGGIDAAREFVLAALNAGKTVVTSNKELFCKYSHELERAAKRQKPGEHGVRDSLDLGTMAGARTFPRKPLVSAADRQEEATHGGYIQQSLFGCPQAAAAGGD